MTGPCHTLLITAGRGPAECRVVVVRLARLILREADDAVLSTATDLANDDSAASVLLALSGDGVERFVAAWTGTVQWIDDGARQGKTRKNWYVAVHALPAPAAPAAIDPAEIRFETMRAGGPGGQHQNTTDSAVRAVHLPTGLMALARDGRSQHQNRKRALERLAALMATLAERDRSAARRREWLDRIEVARGNPRHVFRGPIGADERR